MGKKLILLIILKVRQCLTYKLVILRDLTGIICFVIAMEWNDRRNLLCHCERSVAIALFYEITTSHFSNAPRNDSNMSLRGSKTTVAIYFVIASEASQSHYFMRLLRRIFQMLLVMTAICHYEGVKRPSKSILSLRAKRRNRIIL